MNGALAACLFLAPLAALGQVFYSQEEFFRYLENRQRMALVEAQAVAFAREQAAARAQSAAQRKHDAVMEAAQDELDARALENIRWLQWRREHPDSFSLR